MFHPDTTTVEGRLAIMKKALHECSLEGIVPNQKMKELLNKCVTGTMTIDTVIEELIRESIKVA